VGIRVVEDFDKRIFANRKIASDHLALLVQTAKFQSRPE